MTTIDSTEADARDGAGHSASVDEVPTFTTRQHLEYLVGLIINEWKKTMMKCNVSGDAVTMARLDELAFYNPNEKSFIKFRVHKVPYAIHHKVDALEHMQRIGLPHLPALVEMVKEELAQGPFANDLDESGDGDETSFTGMVSPQPNESSCVLLSDINAYLCSSLSLPRTGFLQNMSTKRRQDLI